MQDDNNTTGAVRTIAIPPETLAAIRIASNMPEMVDAIGKAVKLWGPIGTIDPVDLGDLQQHLGDAHVLLGRLLKDVVILRDAMANQDDH